MATFTQDRLARHAVRRIETHVRTLRPTAAALAVAACFAGVPAFANPTGGTTTHGATAAITNPAANVLQIQTFSNKTIMNWQSFSIGANELTRIMQPSALSALLNRVGAGSAPSEILGALKSNGRVFLINPNGIAFGAGAQIDVAGFVASTLKVSKDDFVDGRMRFTTTTGAKSIVNEGAINAARGGQVYLIGSALKNSGIITAPGGEIVLAAGKSVELVNPGTPNLRVEINARDHRALNLGEIVADSGRVGIYAGLIDQKGTIRADSAVAGEGGRILLKATRNVSLDADSVTSASGPKGGRIEVNAGDTTLVEGTVEATGTSGRGGTVHLLGDHVGVYGDAQVDASGETKGGTVLVGGAFQGKPGVTAVEGARIRNASAVFFGADASISADAVASGNGGKIVLWSDDTTRSYGALSARGGAASGNGGLVETSGKNGLEVTRGPDLRAPRGAGGTWLVDPNDLEVVAGSEITNNSAQPLFSSLDGSSKIGVELINLQLDFGSDVTLTTTNQGPVDSGQQGNIVVSTPILKTKSGVGHSTLTLNAHNDIVINGAGGVGIASTGDPLSVNLQAGGGIDINAGILTHGGFLSAQGSGLVAVNAPVSTISSSGTGGGSISLTSLSNAVRIGEAMASGFFFAASGATGVRVNAPIATLNSNFISLFSSAGSVTVDGAVTGGAFFATGATGVDVNAKIDALSNNQIVLNSGSGAVTVDAPVTGGSFSATGATGVDVNAKITAPFGTTLTSGGGAVTVDAHVAGGSFTATGSTGVEVNGSVTANGSVTLSSSSGPVTVAGAIEGGFFSATAGAGGLLTISAPVKATGATLTADDMQIQDTVTTGTGSVSVRQVTDDRPMNIGTNTPGSLSLSIPELARLKTTGTLTLGNSDTGPVTVSAPIINPDGPSAVTLRSGSTIAIDSAIGLGGNLTTDSGTSTTIGAAITAGGNVRSDAGTSITTSAKVSAGGNLTAIAGTTITTGALVEAGGNLFASAGTSITTGAAVNAGGSLTAEAPTITVGAAIGAGRATFYADELILNNTVTSGSDIDIYTYFGGRPIRLGVDEHGGGALELTETEINNRLVAPGGTVRIGADWSGAISIEGAVAPLGTSTLVLQTGGSITKAEGGSLAVANLGLRASGNVDLSADVAVDTLASSTTGSGQTSFEFANQAGRKLTIGSVDGIDGVQNFVHGATGSIAADKLDVPHGLSFGTLNITPRSPLTVGLDLGGDDTGTRLGLTQSDLSNISANTLVLRANVANITETVNVKGNVNRLVLAPVTPGRNINIIDDEEIKGAGSLDLFNTEVSRVLADSFFIGNAQTGKVTVEAPTGIPVGTFEFGLHSGVANGIGIEINAPLTSDHRLVLMADAMNIGAAVTSGFDSIAIAPNTNSAAWGIDLGSKPNNDGTPTALGLSSTELGRFSAPNGGLIVGNDSSGPVTVSNAVTFANDPVKVRDVSITSGYSITVNSDGPQLDAPGTITLRAPTIDIFAPVTSTVAGNIILVADAMNINDAVTTTGSDIIVTPLTFRDIHLGFDDESGALHLSAGELNNFHTPAAGVLRIGDPNFTFDSGTGTTGNIVVKSAIAPANVSTLSLITNNGSISQASEATIRVANLAAQALGSITLDQGNTVDKVALAAYGGDARFTHSGEGVLGDGRLKVSIVDGLHGIFSDENAHIIADRLDIDQNVSADGVFIAPTAGRGIGVVDSEVAKGTGRLELFNTEFDRISASSITLGNTDTGNINVEAPLLGLFSTDLNLIASNTHTINVDAGLTSTSGRLSFEGGTININAGVATSGGSQNFEGGTININAGVTSAGGNLTFTGGVVDIGAGVSTTDGSGDGRITVIADQMSFTQMLTAGDRITLRPLDGTEIELGGPGGSGVLGLTRTSLSKLSANSLIIGSSGMTSIVSNDAVTLNANVNNATLQTGASGAITLNNTFDAPGNLTLTTGNSGTINVNDTVTAAGNLTLQTGSSGGTIAVNGALNATDGSLTLTTGDGGMISVNRAVKAFGNLSLTTDNLGIDSGDGTGKLSGANVTLTTATSGRNVNFGSAGGEDHLGLDVSELGSIATPGTFTVNANGPSTLIVSAPIQFMTHAADPDTGVNNLSLNAGTINVLAAGELKAPGSITLRANAMEIGNIVESTGNAVISVAPRSFTNTTMTLGSGGGSGLSLSAEEISRFRTNGALQLGTTALVGSINIDAPISGANAGSLTLAANGLISQSGAGIITANRLRLQTNGTIDLQAANRVGTLSGSAFNTTFVNDGTLTIGKVDGLAGFDSFFLTLKADNLVIAEDISGFVANLAPRTSGDAMNLGSNSGGFGISGAELDKIKSVNVTFGNTTTGDVKVSADMERASGRLDIFTAAARSVDVNGKLAAPSGVSIDSGDIDVSKAITASSGQVNLMSRGASTVNIKAAISGNSGVTVESGTINVSAPVTALGGTVNLTSRGVATLNIDDTVSGRFGVRLTSDVTNINAPVRSEFGVVTVEQFSDLREVNLGTKTSAALSLTADELARIDAPFINIGRFNAGALTVSAPISVSTHQLTLLSGGAITQTAKNSETGSPGTPIILTRLDGNGQRIGNLAAHSASGIVDLRAANEVPGSITGSAAGGASDFLFNNELPMKLQSVGVSPGNFPATGGKVLINSGLFIPLPPVDATQPDVPGLVVDALSQIAEIGNTLKAAEDKKKSDEEKKSLCD